MTPRRNRNCIVKFVFFCMIVYVISTFNTHTSSQDTNVKEISNARIDTNEENEMKDKDIVLEPPNVDNQNINKEEKEKVKENEENKIAEDIIIKENNRVKEKEEEDKADEAQNFAILPPKTPDGPGEMGKPYKVDKEKADNETKARIEKGWENFAYNEYVSDLISVHRSLPDLRVQGTGQTAVRTTAD